MTDLVRQDSYAASPLESRMQYAGTLAHAGDLIPTALRTAGQPSQGKILLVMETGAMLGIHPVAALQGVHVIEGKATISPALMSALVRRAGHTLRVRMEGTVSAGDVRATATLIRIDDPEEPFIVTWDLDRAKRAGLWPAGKPGSPWAKYTEAMLKARAISEVCREGATDVLMGVGYVPEELGATVNESGEVVEYTQAPAASPAQERQEAPRSAQDPEPAPEGQSEVPTPETPVQALPDGLYDLDSLTGVEECRQMYRAARQAGHLGHIITVQIPGTEDFEEVKFGEWLSSLGKTLAEPEPEPESDGPAAVLDEEVVVATIDED